MLLATTPAHAQPLDFLVKGSGSTVYFNSSLGKRYFFPSESVFKTWYPDFTAVAEVSDAQLAALPLAGNALYRPGSVLVKITTNPRVFAVSRYGVLHWVTSEHIAATLYGTDWNKKVMDVPDAFFTNYIIGYQINAATEFSPSQEMASAMTPEDNIRSTNFTPPPAPTNIAPPLNAPRVGVTISASNAVLNQTITINATVTENTLPITKLEIHSSAQIPPLQTCLNSTNCGFSFTVQSAPLSVQYYAVAYDGAGGKFTTDASSQPTLTVASASNQIQMSLSPQNVTVGSRVSFTSTVTNPPSIGSHKIYAVIPGETQPVLWKDCATANPCASSTPFYRNTYLYSQLTSGGQTMVSPQVLVTVTGGEPPHPTLTVAGHPATNQVKIDVTAPFGEMIDPITSIVDGTTIDDNAIALCDKTTCSVTIQVNVPGSIRAFTWVGGKYEGSNIVTVTPE